jgi:hypothetical protein
LTACQAQTPRGEVGRWALAWLPFHSLAEPRRARGRKLRLRSATGEQLEAGDLDRWISIDSLPVPPEPGPRRAPLWNEPSLAAPTRQPAPQNRARQDRHGVAPRCCCHRDRHRSLPIASSLDRRKRDTLPDDGRGQRTSWTLLGVSRPRSGPLVCARSSYCCFAYVAIAPKSTTSQASSPTTQASCPGSMRAASPGPTSPSVPSSITTFIRPERT